MIALKSFTNKTVGNIEQGKVLSERVLKCLDVRSLKAAGFIGDEKKVVKEKPKKDIKK